MLCFFVDHPSLANKIKFAKLVGHWVIVLIMLIANGPRRFRFRSLAVQDKSNVETPLHFFQGPCEDEDIISSRGKLRRPRIFLYKRSKNLMGNTNRLVQKSEESHCGVSISLLSH